MIISIFSSQVPIYLIKNYIWRGGKVGDDRPLTGAVGSLRTAPGFKTRFECQSVQKIEWKLTDSQTDDGDRRYTIALPFQKTRSVAQEQCALYSMYALINMDDSSHVYGNYHERSHPDCMRFFAVSWQSTPMMLMTSLTDACNVLHRNI